MNTNVPRMNSTKSASLDKDLLTSETMIKAWLVEVSSNLAPKVTSDGGQDPEKNLKLPDWKNELGHILFKHPQIIRTLRALTLRNIGQLQFSEFSGVSFSRLKRIEDGNYTPNQIEADAMANHLELELNREWASWISEKRQPTEEELVLAATITKTRIVDRDLATAIRYEHEPRQLKKLSDYLQSRGFVEVTSSEINDPREMSPGTYTLGCWLESEQENGEILGNPVDAIVMPFTPAKDMLPIFIEAKSMTDKANPNKRQKEEGKKIQNLARRWKKDDYDPFIFVLELGGTIPKRYLETEENQGIDWFFEHRPEDLDVLLDWYLSLST